MAQTLSTLAVVLANRGDGEQAILKWEAAQHLAEEVGDRRSQAIIRNRLGEALLEKGDLEKAMAHFKGSEAIVNRLDDRLLHSEVSRNMGILDQKRGNLPSARQYLEFSLELAKGGDGKEKEGLALLALGQLESITVWDTSDVGAQDVADVCFMDALEIFASIGNDYDVARTLHARGNRRLERGEVAAGKSMLEEAERIFRHIDAKMGERISRTIAELTEQSEVTGAPKYHSDLEGDRPSIPPAPPPEGYESK